MARLNVDLAELRPYVAVAEGRYNMARRIENLARSNFIQQDGFIGPDTFTHAIFGSRGASLERIAKAEWEKITIAKRVPLAREFDELSEELQAFQSLSQRFPPDILGRVRPYAGINNIQRRRAEIRLELNAAVRAAQMGKAAYRVLQQIGNRFHGDMKEAYLFSLEQFARRASLPIPSYTEVRGMATVRHRSRW